MRRPRGRALVTVMAVAVCVGSLGLMWASSRWRLRWEGGEGTAVWLGAGAFELWWWKGAWPPPGGVEQRGWYLERNARSSLHWVPSAEFWTTYRRVRVPLTVVIAAGVGTLLLVWWSALTRLRHRLGVRPGMCRGCGYDVRGVDAGRRCPECGRAVRGDEGGGGAENGG